MWICPLQLLSRTKAADDPKKKQEIQEKQKKKLPELEDFISKRDYSGAIALLEFLRTSGKPIQNTELWIGFCAFHMGDIPRAKHEYEAILERDKKGAPNEVFTYLACCLFMLGMYKQAEEVALKGNLTARLLTNFF